MLINNDLKRSKPLRQSLTENGFNIITRADDNTSLQAECSELQPDVVIIDTESPSKTVLESVYSITTINTKPVVMFAQDGDKEVVKAATKAGVSAYIVGAVTSERLIPVIEAAVARFEETKQLREELLQANTKLDERKIVERAKGILMRQRDLDENEAYKMLRGMAMQRNMKLADLSNQLIDAAKMLTI